MHFAIFHFNMSENVGLDIIVCTVLSTLGFPIESLPSLTRKNVHSYTLVISALTLWSAAGWLPFKKSFSSGGHPLRVNAFRMRACTWTESDIIYEFISFMMCDNSLVSAIKSRRVLNTVSIARTYTLEYA